MSSRGGGTDLGFVEEPQRDRQGNGVKEVGANGDHDVHSAGLDDLLADFLLGVTRIACAVCHDESGPALRGKCRVELLNPKVVAVVSLGEAEREPPVAGELFLLDLVYVERRVGHHVVERADRMVGVLIVTVGLADVAGEPVQGEVHLGQRHRVFGLLRSED